jgi:magnesium chelatase subunit D
VNESPVYPMSALVGLDELVTALVLCAIDPAIGGVLLRGDKGSGKTTAARALAALLPVGAPFVEVPLGATEDRVTGSVDVAAVLADGEHRFQRGLLEAADGGVLYVDEVNLLPDHLVDVLLDAAATGMNRVERDGFSHVQPSRFVLIGSMNPEEGELRPQLLDRFGLSVRVTTPSDPDERAEAVSRRVAFDADPVGFLAEWETAEADLAARVRRARPVPLEDGIHREVAELCVAAGAEGLRADLVISRAAAALGGWVGKQSAGRDEVAVVAPLALGHRRRTPFGSRPAEDPGLDEIVASALGTPRPGSGAEAPTARDHAPSTVEGDDTGARSQDVPAPAPAEPTGDPDPALVQSLADRGRRGGERTGRNRAPGGAAAARGRTIRAEESPGTGPVAVAPTVVASAVRTAGRHPLRVDVEDLRSAVREQRGEKVVILAVDTSGSMGVAERVAAARAGVLALLADAYQRRDRVAVIAYRDRGAEVVLRPTSSTEIALARLAKIATGGRTPLAAGIDAARSLALEERRRGAEPLLVLVTDGRATAAAEGTDPVLAALEAAGTCRRDALDALVIDCEGPARPLGLARQLAEAMGARYVAMDTLLSGATGGTAMAEVIAGALG